MSCLEPLLPALARRLADIEPSRVLLVGSEAAALVHALRIPSEVRLEPLGATPPADTPYDLALVAGELRSAPAERLGVLARLRDLYARRTLLLTGLEAAQSDTLEHASVMALGFVHVDRYDYEGRSLRLYEFDIGTYKTTPDWLNSRDWANPRLWDKYRW